MNTTIRWSYRVLFTIAWAAGAVTGVTRLFSDAPAEQFVYGYSLCTTAFMVAASFYAVAWARSTR